MSSPRDSNKLAPHPFVDMDSYSSMDDEEALYPARTETSSGGYGARSETNSETNSLSLLFVTNSSRPNVRMYIVVIVSLLGAIVFGLNNSNFGNVQMFESFLETWCDTSRYDHCNKHDALDDLEKDPLDDLEWQSRFVTWTAAYVVLGNTLGILLLGPSLSNNIGRRVCAAVSALLCILGTSTDFSFFLSLEYTNLPNPNTGTVLTVSTESSVAQFMIGRCLTGT